MTFSERNGRSVIRLSDVAFAYTSEDAHAGSLPEDAWVRVIRVPVAPPSGAGLPEIATAEGVTYEVVGTPDEHVLPMTAASSA